MPIPRATCLMLAAVLLLCGCTPEATFYGTHDEGCETLDNLFLYGGQAPYAAGLPLLLFGGQWLAGAQCNEIYYTPPPELGENRNSGVANQPLDQVWPRIIAQIGKSGFKLLRTSKKSGMIELRYVGNPEPYVNCGQLHGNGDPDMNYQTVSSADGSFGGSKGWRSSADYTQQTSLTALMTVTVKPVSAASTRIDVTVWYLFKSSLTRRTGDKKPTTLNDELNFNSGQRFKSAKGLTCQPTGQFEREVLEMAL